MNIPEQIKTLCEYAEWAEANIYYVPLPLPDELKEAANTIVTLQQRVSEAVAWADRLDRAIFEAKIQDALVLKELYKKWRAEVSG